MPAPPDSVISTCLFVLTVSRGIMFDKLDQYPIIHDELNLRHDFSHTHVGAFMHVHTNTHKYTFCCFLAKIYFWTEFDSYKSLILNMSVLSIFR